MRTNIYMATMLCFLLLFSMACEKRESRLIVCPPVAHSTPKDATDPPTQPETIHSSSPVNEGNSINALNQDEIYWAYANSPQDFYTAWANQHGVTPPDNPNALAHVPNALELNGESWGIDDESPRILPVNQISAEQRATLRSTPHAPVLWHEDHQVILAGYAPHTGAQQILQFRFNEIPDD